MHVRRFNRFRKTHRQFAKFIWRHGSVKLEQLFGPRSPIRRRNPSRKFPPPLICFAAAFGVVRPRIDLFRVPTGLDKLSGVELFVTVWFVPVGRPVGLRRYRGKIIPRVRAGCLRAHADRSTVVDRSTVSLPNLCLV